MSKLITPLISILVPSYNSENYITECIMSAFNQTYKNVEVIAFDDGSVDTTVDILEKLVSKKRLKLLKSVTNIGIAKVREKLISYARGEFIYFLDSDDLINDKTLEILYSNASKYSADISTSQILKFDLDSSNIDMSSCTFACNVVEIKGKNSDVQIRALEQPYLSSIIAGKLIKKKFIANYSFDKIMYYEDLAFTYKLVLDSKRIVISHDHLYYYRFNPNSITNSSSDLINKKRANLSSVLSREHYFLQNNMVDLYQWNKKDVFFRIQNLLYLYPFENGLKRRYSFRIKLLKLATSLFLREKKINLKMFYFFSILFPGLMAYFGYVIIKLRKNFYRRQK